MKNITPWRDLITGQQRLWSDPSSVHYNQYIRWIGCHRNVGIELETVKIITEEQWEILGVHNPKLSSSIYNIRQSNMRELQKLFNVTDPIRFVNEVYDFIALLNKAKIPTTGSVHINIQAMHSYDTTNWGYKAYDALGGASNRFENKCGPNFFSPEEFICNLFVGISLFLRNGVHFQRGRKLANLLNTIVSDFCVRKPIAYADEIINWTSRNVIEHSY